MDIGLLDSVPLAAKAAAPQKRMERILLRRSRNNIPIWVQLDGTRIEAVSRHKAGYVLLDVRPKIKEDFEGLGCLRFGPRNVRVRSYFFDDLHVSYLHVDETVVGLPAVALQRLSAHYSQVDGVLYNSGNTANWLVRHFAISLDNYKLTDSIKPPGHAEFERSKVTGEHHTHVLPEEAWALTDPGTYQRKWQALVLQRLRRVSGITEAAVASYLLYLAVAHPANGALLALSTKIWHDSASKVSSALKALCVPLKAMQQAQLMNLSELFELNVLNNRGMGQVDWDKERTNRTKLDVIDVESKDVYDSARRIFNQGVQHGFRYSRMSKADYIASRWQWAPSGSVHSQYPEDDPYIVRNYRHRTKFVALNMMPKEHVSAMASSTPQICAWPSVKSEWDKERAIYGVDLRNTMLTNFAMYGCEGVLKHRFPVGEEAEAGRVHKRLAAMLNDAQSFCYDFDDFNSQHSKSSMYAVLQAYLDTFRPNMTDDQVDAMCWVRDSVLNMLVMRGKEELYAPNGTLFSGWRLTTFMNSVLNYVYMDIAGVFKIGGVVDSVHNGDDVLLAVTSMRAVLGVTVSMASINARAQAAKCNVFSIGEFLRVEHKITHDGGLGAQYLSRAVATAVHSRAESQAPVRVDAALTSHLTRLAELRARAQDSAVALDRLEQRIISNTAKVFHVDVGTLKTMAKVHLVAGGLCGDRWAPVDQVISLIPDFREDDFPEDGANTGMLMPGIYDYAKILTAKMRGVVPHDTVFSAVLTGTRSILALTRHVSIKIENTTLAKYQFARALKGHLRGKVKLHVTSRAQFLGVPPLALASPKDIGIISSYLYGATDPMWSLKVLL